MYTEGFEQWMKANKNMGAPLNDLSRGIMDIYRRIAQQNVEIMTDNFELLTDQFKRLSSIRRPEDLLSLPKEIINEDVTASIQTMQKCIHSAIETIEECSKLFSSVTPQDLQFHPGKIVEKAEKHERERERERR